MEKNQNLSLGFTDTLRSVVGNSRTPVGLHEPDFSGNEWAYVKECIDTGWVSSAGKYVDDFENKIANFTGAAHAVAVVNGTAALHIALKIAGVGEGDEVLIPALSFVATANAVSHCGATPHFVESSQTTLGIDPHFLEEYLPSAFERVSGACRNKKTGKRLAAIVPMHTFGHPVDLDPLLEVAERYSIPVIEDAAESLGSLYKGKHTGTFGKLGVISFNGNKIMTTGGGGAILTNDPKLAELAKHLTTTAKLPHRWEFFHDQIAYNYRMPNINAALGCAQLEQLAGFLEAKKVLAKRYCEAFKGSAELLFMNEPSNCESNFWLNAVRLKNADFVTRDALLDASNLAGYQCRPVWTLLNKLPMYSACPRSSLNVAEELEASLINLPSSAKLGIGDV